MFKPRLVVGDPELLKAVLVRDFDHFADRRTVRFTTEQDAIFNEILTMTTGDHWKGIRSVLSPSFTSGRLKNMFPLVEEKANAMVSHIELLIKTEPSIEIKRTFGLYTLEVISSCAFGMETNTLSDGHSIFEEKVQKMLTNSVWSVIKFIGFMLFPWLFRVLKINLSVPETSFFQRVVEETIRKREEGGARGDFLDLMLEARQEQRDLSVKGSKYSRWRQGYLLLLVLVCVGGCSVWFCWCYWLLLLLFFVFLVMELNVYVSISGGSILCDLGCSIYS